LSGAYFGSLVQDGSFAASGVGALGAALFFLPICSISVPAKMQEYQRFSGMEQMEQIKYYLK